MEFSRHLGRLCEVEVGCKNYSATPGATERKTLNFPTSAQSVQPATASNLSLQ